MSLPGTASVPFAEIVQDDDDDYGIAHVHGSACRHGHDTVTEESEDDVASVTEESEDDVAWVDDAESKVRGCLRQRTSRRIGGSSDATEIGGHCVLAMQLFSMSPH